MDSDVTVAVAGLAQLLRAAQLPVPAERGEMLASRLTVLVDAANELNRKMAPMRDLTPITQFVHADLAQGET